MSDLMDALKSAGLASEKKRKKAERAKAQKQHQELKKKKKKKKKAVSVKVELDPKIEAMRILKERLAAAVSEGMVMDPGGRHRFFFVARNKTIPFLQVSDLTSLHLRTGKAAIVEDPHEEGDHVIVTRDAAIRMEAIDKESVRFFSNQ